MRTAGLQPGTFRVQYWTSTSDLPIPVRNAGPQPRTLLAQYNTTRPQPSDLNAHPGFQIPNKLLSNLWCSVCKALWVLNSKKNNFFLFLLKQYQPIGETLPDNFKYFFCCLISMVHVQPISGKIFIYFFIWKGFVAEKKLFVFTQYHLGIQPDLLWAKPKVNKLGINGK